MELHNPQGAVAVNKEKKSVRYLMTQAQILLFVFTSLAIIITPGQDMILVMSRAISQGAKAGIITAAGVSIGLLGHTLLTAFGLGSMLQTSELLFMLLKFVGAAYLVYLGIRLIFSRSSELDLKKEEKESVSLRKLFWAGAFSNLSNPKITIFYFAYLPQFISSDVQSPGLMLLILGVSFAVSCQHGCGQGRPYSAGLIGSAGQF